MKEKLDIETLSNRQRKIVENLYRIRGATALQIAKIVYNERVINKSQEKYTYNQLAILVEKGFVNFSRSNNKRIRHSIYSLTSKGLANIQSYYLIQDGIEGEGWAPDNNFDNQGFFTYEVHSPPINQIEHHLMLVDFFIRISVDRKEVFEYRNNLYSVRKYDKKQKLRMDAEVKYGERRIAIEIDRGTERFAQLVEKFKNYQLYLQDTNNKDDITDILIVVKDVTNKTKLQQRWETIMAAFLTAMQDLSLKVDLHLCEIGDVYNFMYRHFGFNSYKQNLINIKGDYQKMVGVLYDVYQLPSGKQALFTFGSQYSTKIIRILYETQDIKQLYYIVGITIGQEINFNYNLSKYRIPGRFNGLLNKLNEINNSPSMKFINMPYIGGDIKTKLDIDLDLVTDSLYRDE
ncbi:hypothetical protein JOD29_001876 [Lysinibacillus composti]|uniref:Replication-relaxation n=1 Tax=Lysinibacillus composti TaxID=720633 RepID=A0A3N9UE34_9BACI|nr:replication-relaxation family protein [Lysinibacillus composti]MBM7608629.1 hypothetical protein [Lysinibacillus composti]RQW74549.1 hypothetical protein EBB45_09935 [Lysinibacillus composti]